MTVLTVALIVFTPIKYYLPGVGYGDARQVREFRKLKIRTDSIENELKFRQQYFDHLKKVLDGKTSELDTNKLDLPKVDNITE